jgi:lambda repressor-like predicted transcriptional regulator
MRRTQIIKGLIEAAGMSVKAFSERAQIPYTTLRSILERGISNASTDNVIKICKALGITVDYLEVLSRLDDTHLYIQMRLYNQKMRSQLAANLLNDDFLENLSKAKRISILDAILLMSQVILNEKIDFEGVKHEERLMNDIMEEMITNDEEVQKNISKICFLYFIEQIENQNYYVNELGELIAKTQNYMSKYPEFMELIKDTPKVHFLLDSKENTDMFPIRNPDIRAIAKAGDDLSPSEAAELRKFAERLFPNAFKNNLA